MESPEEKDGSFSGATDQRGMPWGRSGFAVNRVFHVLLVEDDECTLVLVSKLLRKSDYEGVNPRGGLGHWRSVPGRGLAGLSRGVSVVVASVSGRGGSGPWPMGSPHEQWSTEPINFSAARATIGGHGYWGFGCGFCPILIGTRGTGWSEWLKWT
jgi:hypothetical protein